MILNSLIEGVKLALTDVRAAREAASQARAKLAELKMQQRQEDTERERLRADEERDAALRLLDGDAAAPRKTRRVNRLAKLDGLAPARKASIEQQTQRVAQAEAAVDVPQLPFVAATLDLVSEIQGGGVEEVRAILASLAPAAARLIAADQVRLALIGERFAMPSDRAPPFKSLMLVQALTEAIPQRVRPPELSESRLLEAAREISSDTIAQIKG